MSFARWGSPHSLSPQQSKFANPALILLDDSVQALNNYRNLLNQVILEIQTQISSVQNSLNSDKVVQN